MTANAPIRAAWVAALATIVTVALAPPQPAGAGFSSNLVPLSGQAPAGNTGVFDLAVNSSGEMLVAWQEGAIADIEVKLRKVLPDGSLGPVITIADDATRAYSPEIDFAPNGRALVAWLEDASFGSPKSIKARWVEPDGSLGQVVTLVTGGAAYNPGEHEVTATSENAALVAWHNFVSMPPPFRRIEARLVSPESTTSELIFPTSGAGSTGVVGGADTEGGVLLSWRDSGVEAQSVSAAGVPGMLRTPAPGVVADPALTTDGSNSFNLLYRRTSPYSVEYQSLSADGSTLGTQTLEPLSPTQVSASYDLATNAGNRSLAAWSQEDGSAWTAKARFLSGGEPAGPTFTIPTGLSIAPAVTAAIGGTGEGALALLLRQEGELDSLWGRLLPAGGPPGAPLLLSAPGTGPGLPRMSIAASDVGLITWAARLDPEDSNSPFQIFARQILPPPSCPDASGTIVQGMPTRIDLRCSGLQLGAPEIVTPPSHGSLTAPETASQSVVYTPEPGYAGADSFSFRGTNPGGAGATRTASLSVGEDTIAPVIESFQVRGRGVGKAASSAKRKRGRGKPRFRLRFSEPATVTIVIERPRRCRKRPRGPRVCVKYRKFGTLATGVARSSETVRLSGRIKKRLLRQGRVRARAVAKDLAGNRSKARRLVFKLGR